MHKLLARQIKRTFGAQNEGQLLINISDFERLPEFLEMVSQAYEEFERERALFNHAIETSSAELTELNEKIRKSERQQTNTILNSLYDGVLAVDSSGKISFANPAAKKILGHEDTNLLGHEVSEFIIIFNSSMQPALGNTFSQTLFESSFESISGEQFVLTKNLQPTLVSFKATPIIIDEVNSGTVISFQDISEKRLREQQLQLLKQALDAAANMILITDNNGTVEYANRAFIDFTGYSKEEIEGHNVSLIKSGMQEHRFYEELWEKVRKGELWEGELVNRKKDGTLYPEEMTITPIATDMGRSHYIAIKKDITERKQQEQAIKEAMDKAVEASRLKSEFLSTMSHEIRTPMNGIIGMTDLLIETALSPTQKDYTQTIKESAEALLAIINDILDFSKIEAGKLDIEVAEYEPIRAVESVVDIFAHKAQQKKIDLLTYIDPTIPPTLLGDITRIRQILMNLVGNAIKFTKQGDIVIKMLLWTNENTKKIRIEVKDSGIGMSKETVSKLFTQFSQADSSTTRKFGGTGLGLAICKKLVKLMGGEIGVISELNIGSLFWVELPLASSAVLPIQPLYSHGWLSRLNVLVVDDSFNSCAVLRDFLSSWGIENQFAHSGISAIKALHDNISKQERINLVLINQILPDIDGLSLTKNIRSNPSFHTVKIILIAVSNTKTVHDTDHILDNIIQKPIKQSLLFDALLKLVSPAELNRSGDEQKNALFEQDEKAANAHKNGLKLLLAEDNVVNQRVASIRLEKLGYDVDIASNGLEALQAFKTNEYAAILMDCQMPEMDGYESTRQIRKLERKKSKRTPIIAMTANAMQGDQQRCIEAGMDDYLSKPVNKENLEATLCKWVNTISGESSDGLQELRCESSELLSKKLMTELFGTNKKLIEEIFAAFLETLDRAVKILDNNSSSEEAKRTLHELKGSSGNLGIASLRALAKRIEAALKNNDDNELGEAAKKLKEIADKLKAEIQVYLGEIT